jgi:hypothetical protein
MIVTLGHRQLEAVRAVATDRHRRYLTTIEVGPNRHAIAMPAAAWKALLPGLEERAFNKWGEWRSKRPGYRNALVRISRDLMTLEMHPAYRGQAMLLPPPSLPTLVGFPGEAPGSPHSPYPSEDRGMLMIFEPRSINVKADLGGGPVTMPAIEWEPRLPERRDLRPGLFLDIRDHRGWLPTPVRSER